jgi:hypothetical protein
MRLFGDPLNIVIVLLEDETGRQGYVSPFSFTDQIFGRITFHHILSYFQSHRLGISPKSRNFPL